jgi:hypothetical protein
MHDLASSSSPKSPAALDHAPTKKQIYKLFWLVHFEASSMRRPASHMREPASVQLDEQPVQLAGKIVAQCRGLGQGAIHGQQWENARLIVLGETRKVLVDLAKLVARCFHVVCSNYVKCQSNVVCCRAASGSNAIV